MSSRNQDAQDQSITVSSLEKRSMVNADGRPQYSDETIRISYLRQSEMENFLSAYQHHVLALVNYCGKPPTSLDSKPLSISLNMQQYNDLHLTEVWTCPPPISTGQVNGVNIAYNEQILFGYVQCEESNDDTLEKLVYPVYNQILKSLPILGYPHLYRIWNYFPLINGDQYGLERYKRFCIGRHRAFSENYDEFKLVLPAASALGTLSGPFQLYFLAGKQKANHIENPRQISAYDYPSMYGPKSPSFARATLTSILNTSYLFLAGTASIVGHATQHKTDCLEQTKETLANLESLIEQANKDNRDILSASSSLSLLKVYVRRIDHIEIIKETIEEYLGHHTPALYLGGEMCRRNLLVEIEGLYTFEKPT